MPKITFLGAGSTVFAKNLLGDILAFPELAESHIVLHDIDENRLRTSEIVTHKVAQTLNARPTISTSLDRRAALANADYAICMIQVGGYKPSTVIDFESPKSMGCAKPLAIRWALAASCVGCARFRCYWRCVQTWKSCART